MTYSSLSEIAAAALAGRQRAVGVTYSRGTWTVRLWMPINLV